MPTAPRPAKPSKHIFDPFNSSATGHQRAENRLSGSTSWRDSRSCKLNEQFGKGAGGGKRLNDTVGAGSLEFGEDGRTESGGWVRGAKGLRTDGQKSIQESIGLSNAGDVSDRASKRVKTEASSTSVVNPFTPFVKPNGSFRESSWTSHEPSPSHRLLSPLEPVHTSAEAATEIGEPQPEPVYLPQIFKGLTFYINGSTAPLLSDHKLKHILSDHGGRVSVGLGRRRVTHVIAGRPSSGGGSGGGLAGSKIHKEITQTRGSTLKYVTADWVVESVKAGKRLPESRFSAVRLAPQGTGNVAKMFGVSKDDKS